MKKQRFIFEMDDATAQALELLSVGQERTKAAVVRRLIRSAALKAFVSSESAAADAGQGMSA